MRVCGISKTDQRMVALVKDVGTWFNTYRYRLHVSVLDLANQFKTKYKNETEYDKLLEEFIDEKVWKSMLNMQLKITDQQKLNKNKVICSKLKIFVSQVVKTVLTAQKDNQDTQFAIKKCDEHTIDLKIPTKLGIAGSLAVQELLCL